MASSSWNWAAVSKDLVPSTRDREALRFSRGRQRPANLSTKGPVRSLLGTSTFIIGLARALELPDDTEDHLSLATGQVQALVGYGAHGLVPEDAHRLLVQNRRLSRRVEEVRRMHAERFCQGDHLFHGRVGQPSCPDLLDLFLGQIPQAHAGYLGVSVGFPRRLVLYDVEEPAGLFGDALVSRRRVNGCP